MIASVRRLLGSGAGLTPEGDDLLIGAVAAFRHVGCSLGRRETAAVLDAVSVPIEDAAAIATTRLSASLIRHALVGAVPAPVGDLLRALTGRGELVSSLSPTLAIGSSSGRALAEGVACGAIAACEVTT